MKLNDIQQNNSTKSTFREMPNPSPPREPKIRLIYRLPFNVYGKYCNVYICELVLDTSVRHSTPRGGGHGKQVACAT